LQSLGFEDKFAMRMVVEEKYLYVCAASNGLWRKNIFDMTEWEYLGLADTSLGRYTNVGVLDVDVKGDDILVAYNGCGRHVPTDSTVGIWRSTNAGENWFRSDCGIPESITDPYECNIITSIQRSPKFSDLVIAVLGPAVYLSTNDGFRWQLIRGNRGVFANTDYVRWHRHKQDEVWFFGITSVFAPYLLCAVNYGRTVKNGVNFNSLGFPSDGSVDDVAFDIGNTNIIYASTTQGLIKTTDGGYTWQTNIRPDTGFINSIIEDPRRSGVLYLGGGKRVYYSSDGAQTINTIEIINTNWISTLALDIKTNQLFIGTTNGVYSLKVVCN
jgi:hypothetical protein